MIKGRGTDKDGNPLLVIGLSDENWHRLRTGGDEGLGRPIKFNIQELGLDPMTVLIVAGTSEEDISNNLLLTGIREKLT